MIPRLTFVKIQNLFFLMALFAVLSNSVFVKWSAPFVLVHYGIKRDWEKKDKRSDLILIKFNINLFIRDKANKTYNLFIEIFIIIVVVVSQVCLINLKTHQKLSQNFSPMGESTNEAVFLSWSKIIWNSVWKI